MRNGGETCDKIIMESISIVRMTGPRRVSVLGDN